MATKGMETVSTNQIISSVAAQYSEQLPKKVTKELLTTFLQAIESEIISGKKARIDKLGVLYAKERAARKGRNPQTGEEISIPASKKVAFRPAKSLKEAIGVAKKTTRPKKK
jgi:DNA-binding protein HU-beta